MINSCPVCDGGSFRDRFAARLPLVASIAEPALNLASLFGDMMLTECQSCRHLFNRAFEPDLLDRMYGNVGLTNLPVHPSMDQRLDSLLDWLPPVLGTHVVEIGAGGGHFARRLATTARRVTLFEPCRELTRAMIPETNIHLIQDYYTADTPLEAADLFVCRQVMEHVVQPGRLLAAMAARLKVGGSVYLEVPGAEFILDHAAALDIHMPHVQYFSQNSLMRLAATNGLYLTRTLTIKNGHDWGMLFSHASPAPLAAALSNPFPWPDLSSAAAVLRDLLAQIPGRLAIYGASMIAERLMALSPSGRFTAAFDDSKASIGKCLYTETSTLPIMVPTPTTLRAVDTVIIGTYLHDLPMAERLRQRGFQGRILSARPDPVPANAFGLRALTSKPA